MLTKRVSMRNTCDHLSPLLRPSWERDSLGPKPKQGEGQPHQSGRAVNRAASPTPDSSWSFSRRRRKL